MAQDDIPQWAQERAAALANGARSVARYAPEYKAGHCAGTPSLYAFARYIAAHEEAPVDPLIKPLAKALGQAFPYTFGTMNPNTRDADAAAFIHILAGNGLELASLTTTEGGK
jgi:hypothetical protein